MNNSECKNLKGVNVSATMGSSYAAHWFCWSTLSDLFLNQSTLQLSNPLPIPSHQAEDNQKTSSSVFIEILRKISPKCSS